MYHIVLAAKERHEAHFLEIGSDKLRTQSSPVYNAMKWVTIIKSITAKEIFKCCFQIKTQLWGGAF
jgi:hypothetical protein